MLHLKVLIVIVAVLMVVGLGITVLAAPDGAPLPLQWETPVKVAEGQAFRGPWRMNESDFRYVDDPAVAITDQGYIALAWVNQEEQNLYFQLYDPENNTVLDQPIDVSRSPEIFSWLPRIAVDSSEDGSPQKIYLIWQEIVFSGGSHGGELFFSRSEDGGRTFQPPLNLSNTTAGVGKGRLSPDRWDNGSFDLLLTEAGDLYVSWTEYEGPLWVSHSYDGGVSFSEPVHVAGTENDPTRAPSLAAAKDGTLWLAWTRGEDHDGKVHLAYSKDNGGSFSDPLLVGSGRDHVDAPSIGIDSAGTLHLAYAQARSLNRYSIYYSRLKPGEDQFERPRGVSSTGLLDLRSQAFPTLALDPRDMVYIIWETFPVRSARPQGLTMTLSLNGGTSFFPPGPVPESGQPENGHNGSGQGLLMKKLAASSGGEFVVANSTYLSGSHSAVWLYRGKNRFAPSSP